MRKTDKTNDGKVPAMIPRDVLFGNPVNAAPLVSPDGTRLAYLAPVNNVLNVWVRTIGRQDDRPITKDTDRGIRMYFWAEDAKHVLYLQDKGGNENWLLHITDIRTGTTENLTPFDKVQIQIIAHDKNYPDMILFAMNKRDERFHDAFRLDLKTKTLSLEAENPGTVLYWLADAEMSVRAAVSTRQDGGNNLLIRKNRDDAWKTLLEWSPDDSLTSGPFEFTKDGAGLYLFDSRGSNTKRLVRMDISSGETTVVAEDPYYDVFDVIADPDSREIEAVSFMRDRKTWTPLAPAISGDFQAIKAIDDGDFSIVSRDNEKRAWTLSFEKDNGPVSYYAYDAKTRKAVFLFDNRPVLKQYTLSRMEPFEFTARDGLVVHGYATFPAGADRKNLPTVLNVHGGPWHRDYWGYHSEAQWFANRGYLCLQINFRGSTGYGKKFLNAADREWGGRMHDDLIDGVNWAIQKGFADKTRIAIYGGSYGGYAALVGATFTPDVFRCAVDIVGPSSLLTLVNTIPAYWETFRASFYKRVGNPATEEEFLRSRSPLYKAGSIKIPMLIAQGANDPRVKQSESEQIVAAMKKKGIDYEYMLFPDEGHGFAKPANRLKFYAAAEKFLAKHLGGRCET